MRRLDRYPAYHFSFRVSLQERKSVLIKKMVVEQAAVRSSDISWRIFTGACNKSRLWKHKLDILPHVTRSMFKSLQMMHKLFRYAKVGVSMAIIIWWGNGRSTDGNLKVILCWRTTNNLLNVLIEHTWSWAVIKGDLLLDPLVWHRLLEDMLCSAVIPV